MKKILFTIKPHSVIDVITNSSSELFVGKNQSKENIIEMIKEIYPNYLKEYHEVKNIDDLTFDELDIYFQYMCLPHHDLFNSITKVSYPILNGFTFEELYVEDEKFKEYSSRKQYRLKSVNNEEYGNFVVEDNFEEIKNKLDPERELFFLFSLDDNPDWDEQERLSEIMERLHLG